MDILLINPYSQESHGINEATVEVPVGLLSLAAFLRHKGMDVDILDAYAMQKPQDDVIEAIKRLKPKVVGISVNIFSFLQAVRYTQKIKEISEEIVVIWGGPHATIAPELCFASSKLDYLVVGEGEITLFEVMQHILNGAKPYNVKGLAYKEADSFKINAPQERILNLDELPFPAYEFLPDLKHYRARTRRRPFMGIVTSRGCPYSCVYCSKDVFKNRITFRSPGNIIEEIGLLVEKYHIRQIDILDDNFTMDPGRAEELCDLILKRSYDICINLQSGIRADRVNESLMRKMRRAGVFKLGIGVETGSKEVLKSIKKELDLSRVLEVSALARKLGISTIGFFMIGLPGDNPETLQETIDFAIKMNPHVANFMMTIPFYGTELYRRVKQEGELLVDTKDGISSGFYAAQAYYKMDSLTPEIMIKYYKKAYRDFYFRFGKVVDILSTIRSIEELKWFVNATISTLFPKK